MHIQKHKKNPHDQNGRRSSRTLKMQFLKILLNLMAFISSGSTVNFIYSETVWLWQGLTNCGHGYKHVCKEVFPCT